MYKVHGMAVSGNCHKVKLILELLGEPYEWREVNTMKGETRTPEFLAMNPEGRVPVLEFAPGRFLPESNAILCYLADGSEWWPAERLARAETLQWMFFEQYSHEPYIAVARFIRKFKPSDPRASDMGRIMERGNQALGVMEKHLAKHDYFVCGRRTIADIALYAYTHRAADGGFDLARYPAVSRWLKRLETKDGIKPIPD
jgi:glutathione S-transferase